MLSRFASPGGGTVGAGVTVKTVWAVVGVPLIVVSMLLVIVRPGLGVVVITDCIVVGVPLMIVVTSVVKTRAGVVIRTIVVVVPPVVVT